MVLALKTLYVPKLTESIKNSWKEKRSFPINKEVRKAVHEKNKKHRQWMSAKKCTIAEQYAKSRNKATAILRKSKRIYERGIAMKSKINPKLFWSHTRKKLKTKSSVAHLLSNPEDRDSMKFTDEANILQKQFASVFTHEPGGMPILTPRTNSRIADLEITGEMAKIELVCLNTNKSTGPDDIHLRLLKEQAEHIAELYYTIQ